MKRVLFIALCTAFLFGCELFKVPTYEYWDHEVVAANYTEEGGEYTYTYHDTRFNQTDWYDIYMDNSYWGDGLGWGPFDSVFDSGVFYYQPMYYDGYVQWRTYAPPDIVDATLRFYWMHY